MKIKPIWILAIGAALLASILLTKPGLADDKARDRKTLQGIQSVIVTVPPVEAEWQTELEKVGLSESRLQADIEAQLGKAGIRVIAEEASKRSGFEGILYVRLRFNDPEPAKKSFMSIDGKEEKIEVADVKKKYIYAVRLNLRQLVSLKRDPSAEVFSITWQTESVGMRRLMHIREDIKSIVDRFIEAYTSENPKS